MAFRKDFASLQQGANDLTAAANQQKLAQLQALLKQKGNQQDIDLLAQMKQRGLVPENGTARVGDVEAGANRFQGLMGTRVSSEAQRFNNMATKELSPYADQMNTLTLMHSLLDNPNSFDQKKLQILNARMVEGKGQRLLDSVIQSMGADKNTLQGTVQDKLNYFNGAVKSGLTRDQMNGMRDTAFKYQDEIEPQYEAAKAKVTAFAPQLAPDIAASGSLDPLVNASLANTEGLHQGLQKRRQDYEQLSQHQTTLDNPNPAYQQPQSKLDQLKSLLGFGGGQAAPSRAPAAPPAAPPGADQLSAAVQAEMQRRAKAAQTPAGQ